MSATSKTSLSASHTPRIVDDLISIILESNDHWWPRDFQRLALISPGWLGPIRRRLYACPSLQTFRACNLFVRTVKENPHLLGLVQGIDLRPTIPVGSCFALSEQDMTSVRFILNLKGLRTVTIGGELAIQAERFIQMMSDTRTIISLHVDGNSIEDSEVLCWRQLPSLEWNETIAYRFTGLRSLRLTGLQLSLSDPPLPYAMRVQELVLDDVTVPQGSIQHLCHESWDSVRSLVVSSKAAEDPDEILRDLLECCINLEELHYESCGAGARGDIFMEDVPLPSLRALRLYDIDIGPHVLWAVHETCKSLETLSVLGRTVQLKHQDWIGFLGSGALPSLRTLCVPSGSNQPPLGFVLWTEDANQQLRTRCTARGVVLS
ncbi:hypothetical protein EIP86_000846 [Pleurotus ostreatoroseus]|nr:hypothetical protein EIP86_000846 [Pleurotus ostreatoroseus]